MRNYLPANATSDSCFSPSLGAQLKFLKRFSFFTIIDTHFAHNKTLNLTILSWIHTFYLHNIITHIIVMRCRYPFLAKLNEICRNKECVEENWYLNLTLLLFNYFRQFARNYFSLKHGISIYRSTRIFNIYSHLVRVV